jgi:hypothetical protein
VRQPTRGKFLSAHVWLCAQAAVAIVLMVFATHSPNARADFGIAKFEAGTCNFDTPECAYTSPESQFYTQATGHPPIGLTGFEVNTEPFLAGKKPIGNVKDVRVDIPPGLRAHDQIRAGVVGGLLNMVV